jgi:hypothetical protein
MFTPLYLHGTLWQNEGNYDQDYYSITPILHFSVLGRHVPLVLDL